eukprot:12415577-Karenia_brevis.AAC.1
MDSTLAILAWRTMPGVGAAHGGPPEPPSSRATNLPIITGLQAIPTILASPPSIEEAIASCQQQTGGNSII